MLASKWTFAGTHEKSKKKSAYPSEVGSGSSFLTFQSFAVQYFRWLRWSYRQLKKKIVHYWKKNKSNFQFLFITMNREEFKIFDDFHSDEPFLVFASVFLNIQMLLEVGFNKKLFLVMSLFRSNAFSRSFRLCLFSNVKWRILIRIINVLDWKEYAHKHISPIRQMTDDTTYFSSRLYSVVFRKFWKKRFIYQQSIANLTNYGW